MDIQDKIIQTLQSFEYKGMTKEGLDKETEKILEDVREMKTALRFVPYSQLVFDSYSYPHTVLIKNKFDDTLAHCDSCHRTFKIEEMQ